MNFKYCMIHNNWDPHLVFPLVVAKAKQEKIYIEPIWGNKLETITVEGAAILAEKFRAKLDDVNYNKVPIGAEPFVYLVRRLGLVFAKTFSEKGEYELEKYTIPGTAKQIVIEYRLRESPDSVGPALTLVSKLA